MAQNSLNIVQKGHNKQRHPDGIKTQQTAQKLEKSMEKCLLACSIPKHDTKMLWATLSRTSPSRLGLMMIEYLPTNRMRVTQSLEL